MSTRDGEVRQIVIAAEVTASSPDFGHLQPMIAATTKELQAVGVSETPGVVVADSGSKAASTSAPTPWRVA